MGQVGWLAWLMVGGMVGLFAYSVTHSRMGLIADHIIGIVGTLLGGFLISLLYIKAPSAFRGGLTLAWADMMVAFVGTVLILILFGGYYRSRRSLA